MNEWNNGRAINERKEECKNEPIKLTNKVMNERMNE
jgi:hypothetical protein